MCANRYPGFHITFVKLISEHLVTILREFGLHSCRVNRFQIKPRSSVKNNNLFNVRISCYDVSSSSYHVLRCKQNLLFQIFKVQRSSWGGIKVGDIGRGSLKNCILIVTFPRSIHGHISKVVIGSQSIGLMLRSKGFFSVDKSISSLFQMTNVNIAANGVSNEEDFFSLGGR